MENKNNYTEYRGHVQAHDDLSYKTESVEKQIRGDFYLIYSILWDIIIYFFMFLPRILMSLFSKNSYVHRRKLVSFPFDLVAKVSNWFFQAKYTAFIFILLIICFLLQVVFIMPDSKLYFLLATHPQDLFSFNFYSVLTSVFMHLNIFHLISNLIALIIFGRIVERQMGARILWFFVFCGVLANIISHMVSIMTGNVFYSVGASGAIAGLVIMAIITYPFSFTGFFIIPLPLFLVGWILIILDLIGVSNMGSINHYAHLGGYLAVFIVAILMEIRLKKKVFNGILINIAMFSIVFFVLDFEQISRIINLIAGF